MTNNTIFSGYNVQNSSQGTFKRCWVGQYHLLPSFLQQTNQLGLFCNKFKYCVESVWSTFRDFQDIFFQNIIHNLLWENAHKVFFYVYVFSSIILRKLNCAEWMVSRKSLLDVNLFRHLRNESGERFGTISICTNSVTIHRKTRM